MRLGVSSASTQSSSSVRSRRATHKKPVRHATNGQNTAALSQKRVPISQPGIHSQAPGFGGTWLSQRVNSVSSRANSSTVSVGSAHGTGRHVIDAGIARQPDAITDAANNGATKANVTIAMTIHRRKLA